MAFSVACAAFFGEAAGFYKKSLEIWVGSIIIVISICIYLREEYNQEKNFDKSENLVDSKAEDE